MKRVFIIAEAGVNHNGNLDTAFALVDIAANAGADAVKFQAFKADHLVTHNAEKAAYQTKNLGDTKLSQHTMLKKLELTDQNLEELKQYADTQDIEFLATPFDYDSVDSLEGIVPAYKISSGDCTNLPFLEYIAKKQKPVILSTGMATLQEVSQAVNIFKSNKNNNKSTFQPLTLLHCTTNYPCSFEAVNLNAMLTLKKEFKVPVGYSDHTDGTEVAVAAAALGARVIEKHFTLDKKKKGPDHQASLEPEELQKMIREIRNIEKAMGTGVKAPHASEQEIIKHARRSLVFATDLKAGSILTEKDITAKRPGTGISPEKFKSFIGRTLKKDVLRDDHLSFEVLNQS